MSKSSYSSTVSSSSSDDDSSSSSSSGSSNDSVKTGSFSSSSVASLSSCSTIVAPKPCLRPFGSPEYNYFWIENKSKTNPRRSYFYNYKSHKVVWQRPLPNNVSLPFYTSWTPGRKIVSEEEDDAPVSDFENALQRRKRVAIKHRNKRLTIEEQACSIQILSIKRAVKSKRMLETFWKLHRYPGESLKDVKKRLLDSSINSVQPEIKTEVLDIDDINNVPIKKEPIFEWNNNIKTDSDSDPENVSFLIKQEYLMNCGSTDNESNNEERFQQSVLNEFQDEIDSDEDEDEDEDENDNMNNVEIDEIDHFENDHELNLLADFLEVEINENDKENVCLFNYANNNNIEENVNWKFENFTENCQNSNLTRSVINSVYKEPIAKKKKRRRKKKQQMKKVPKLIIKTKPSFHIKQESDNDNEKPVVCEMYGTRTVNYNELPPKVKVPRWQCCTNLSDSSDDSSAKQFEMSKVTEKVVNPFQKIIPNQSTQFQSKPEERVLELKSWFPKRRKRQRSSRNKSNSSWCVSSFSDCSDIDESDITLLKIKKEKKSSSFEEEESQSENDISSTIAIKKEKDPDIMSVTTKVPEVDLSIVKIERKSPNLEDAQDVDVFEESQEDGYLSDTYATVDPMEYDFTSNAIAVAYPKSKNAVQVAQTTKDVCSSNSSSDSSSSSDASSSSSLCSCSRSSCSCGSSSSEEENDEETNGMKMNNKESNAIVEENDKKASNAEVIVKETNVDEVNDKKANNEEVIVKETNDNEENDKKTNDEKTNLAKDEEAIV